MREREKQREQKTEIVEIAVYSLYTKFSFFWQSFIKRVEPTDSSKSSYDFFKFNQHCKASRITIFKLTKQLFSEDQKDQDIATRMYLNFLLPSQSKS